MDTFHVLMRTLSTAWELLVVFMFTLVQDLHSPHTALPWWEPFFHAALLQWWEVFNNSP